MEIKYNKPRHIDDDSSEEIVFTSDPLQDSAQPCFEISSQNVTQSKDFISKFEDINQMETTITLKIEGTEHAESFDVTWCEIEYLTKDLSKLLPYTIPIILFNFNLITGPISNAEKRGLYFTTRPILDQLLKMGKIPLEI
jgi:hypothetical protein